MDYEQKLLNVEATLERERTQLKNRLRQLNEQQADAETIFAVRRELAQLPKDAETARERWPRAMQDNLSRAAPLAGMPPHAQPFAGDPQGTPQEQETFELSRRNFLALMFCLMVGTVGLPHLLTRFYTTPSVAETRSSVAWALVFIALLYLSAPALAVLVKYEVLSHLVGQNFESLPTWMVQWAKVDPALLSISDVNGDRILQFSELKLGADLVMLATPEIGGLPYVVSGLVAAGGLAAALSTADGLLLTMGNALAHDLYFRGLENRVDALRRVIISKFALLVVALAAAYVAAQRPAGILSLVSASFSLAAATFVPPLVLGIFWRNTSRAGAVGGMLVGLGVTVYYMLINVPAVRAALGLHGSGLWFGIQPVSAGVFGVAAGLGATLVLSVLSRAGRQETVTPGNQL
jgi:cation/acetate symporter